MIGSLNAASANIPATLAATTDPSKTSDGRFALLGVYYIGPVGGNPQTYSGVSVVMTGANAGYALNDGNGNPRPFLGTTGVFPSFQESLVQSYLENGGTGIPYIMNTYDQSGQPNRYVIGSGTQSIVDFSNATAGGTATIVVVPVPEPASFAALGLGLLVLFRRQRRAG